MVKVPLDQGSFCQGSFGPRFLWTEVPLVKVPLGQGSFAKVPLDQVPLVKVPLGLHRTKSIGIQLFRYNFVLNSSSDSVAKISTTLGGT